RDRPRLAELVDLDNPGRDRTARRLPHECGAEAARKGKTAEKGETPVLRLDAGGTDPVIPDLRRALVGRDGKGRASIADRRSSKHASLLFAGIGGGAGAMGVARPDAVSKGSRALHHGLTAAERLRPGGLLFRRRARRSGAAPFASCA